MTSTCFNSLSEMSPRKLSFEIEHQQMPDLEVMTSSDGTIWCTCSQTENRCLKMEVQKQQKSALASKFTSLHLGLNVLAMQDLKLLFLELEQKFRRKALALPEFQALSFEDREGLLLANSPLYFQLCLAKYFNSNSSGTQQLESLFSKEEMPANLKEIQDHLLIVTLR